MKTETQHALTLLSLYLGTGAEGAADSAPDTEPSCSPVMSCLLPQQRGPVGRRARLTVSTRGLQSLHMTCLSLLTGDG